MPDLDHMKGRRRDLGEAMKHQGVVIGDSRAALVAGPAGDVHEGAHRDDVCGRRPREGLGDDVWPCMRGWNSMREFLKHPSRGAGGKKSSCRSDRNLRQLGETFRVNDTTPLGKQADNGEP